MYSLYTFSVSPLPFLHSEPVDFFAKDFKIALNIMLISSETAQR